ncbi:acyl carrier protein [Actinomadura roseirufa]|uniref:acyl carrier protein n=1 Tax=Actinomadura roseirufa TaxID=2094049 RepID=UPI001041A365|nr:acyl carrier protein [Actinomadura roseirufa]
MTRAATTRSERLQQLRDILIDVLEIEPEELTDTSHFVNDHGADSLMAIDIISSIDRNMGVHLPNEVLPELLTLTAVMDCVERYGGPSDE